MKLQYGQTFNTDASYTVCSFLCANFYKYFSLNLKHKFFPFYKNHDHKKFHIVDIQYLVLILLTNSHSNCVILYIV
jgi:hypothetical protein